MSRLVRKKSKLTRNKHRKNQKKLKLQKRPRRIRRRAEASNMAEESKQTEDQAQSGSGSFLDSLPLDDLKTNFSEFASAWGENALKGLGDKVTDFVDRMSSGDSPMRSEEHTSELQS